MASDARLVRASQRGDQRAFGRIVRRYQSLVCTVTYSGTGDLSASEDLAQETFIAAWQKLSDLRDPARLRGWLCTIARNLAVDWLRRRQSDVTNGAVSVEHAGHLESTTPTPIERSLSEERASLVWGALNEMPEDYRIPLILYYREQQSVGRVADALDLSRSAVKLRLMRGRSMLKDRVVSLVEDTLKTTRPGDTFSVGVAAALAGVAGHKAAGAGSTILGLSLAKAAVIGTVAVGAAVGGGLALQRLAAPYPEPAAAPLVAVEAPKPPAVQPALIYADRLPKKAAAMIEMDVKSLLATLGEASSAALVPAEMPTLEGLAGQLCQTKDASAVDLASPVRLVSSGARGPEPRTTLFRITDADRYLANLIPGFVQDYQEGTLQVYSNAMTGQTVLVDTLGRWAVVGLEPSEARAVAEMMKAGEFPAAPTFGDAPLVLAYRLPLLRPTSDISFDALNALPPPLAMLIRAAETVWFRQVETVAVALSFRQEPFSLNIQVQPIAGTPLAQRIATAGAGGLHLLKYVPADSLAVLDSQLPDLAGLLPSRDPVPLPVRALRVLGDEAALAVGRGTNGSAQLILAAKVKDPKAAQALTDELAGLVTTYLSNPPPGQPALPLHLNRSVTVYNGHSIEVWDFDLTTPLGQGQVQPAGVPWAAVVPMALGKDLKLYEFTMDDTLFLAFGDGVFERVKQILDGNLTDIEHADRFKQAMAGMPAQPQAVGLLEAEKLTAWLAEVSLAMYPGRGEPKDLKFEEGLPVVLAAHVIGKDVIEVPVHVPRGALRAYQKLYAAAEVAPPPAPAPLPPAAPPQVQPQGLHGAASAGNAAEVERLIDGGADVNARGPGGRSPLHYAAEQGGLEVVQLLLNKGADANAEDQGQCTPLHLAAQGGHREVSEALLKAGAEVNAVDAVGWTPTGRAAQAGHKELAAFLAEHGGVE